jgi:acyl-CoA thioester hydrolase
MEPDIAALLQPYHVVITLPVQWGEQDGFQHVNHAVYFRWFESARIAFWDRAGLWGMVKQSRVGPILASVSCDYRRQLTYPDTVLVGSRVVRLGRTSFAMEQVVVSSAQRAVAAQGRSTIVVFDYAASAPTPIPVSLRRAMEELQGQAFGPVDEAL